MPAGDLPTHLISGRCRLLSQRCRAGCRVSTRGRPRYPHRPAGRYIGGARTPSLARGGEEIARERGNSRIAPKARQAAAGRTRAPCRPYRRMPAKDPGPGSRSWVIYGDLVFCKAFVGGSGVTVGQCQKTRNKTGGVLDINLAVLQYELIRSHGSNRSGWLAGDYRLVPAWPEALPVTTHDAHGRATERAQDRAGCRAPALERRKRNSRPETRPLFHGRSRAGSAKRIRRRRPRRRRKQDLCRQAAAEIADHYGDEPILLAWLSLPSRARITCGSRRRPRSS
jgi:hypothetical protein